jgi:hypothetical protein
MRMATNRRSQIESSAEAALLWVSSWHGVALMLLPFAALILALVLGVRPVQAQALAAPAAKAATAKRPELVFDRDCLEAVKPGHDFQLHVPVDKNGNPVDALIYSTGKLDFRVKAPDCAKVDARPSIPRKSANEKLTK